MAPSGHQDLGYMHSSSMIRWCSSHGLQLHGFISILIFTCALPLAHTDQTEDDRQALLCFKSHLSDPSRALASWSDASLQLCSWPGVTCGAARSPRRVTALNLTSQGLAGTVPPCLANLTALETLQLSGNGFHGAVPPELGLLSRLSYLNLSSNMLEGSIPAALGTLPELQTLVLSGNRLTGGIPSLLGSRPSLVHVDLGSNLLTGEIPVAMASSSSLQVLRLIGNSLSGELPTALFNTSSLTAICLQKNNFSGAIPPVTATSAPVKYLSIRENSLSGEIPSSLGNLSSLIYLMLHKNHLIGSIPESLGRIPRLERLSLNGNLLSGHVPSSLFNMSSLTYLGLANNSLVGELPSDIGFTLPNIETLVLTANKFQGTIPASLTNASNMEILYLSINRLSGLVPSFGPLPNLQILDVSFNALESGDWGFLSSLSNCTRLNELFLDSNNLDGELPRPIGDLSSSLDQLWLRENRISGPIPSEIGNLKNLAELYLDYNLLIGSIPQTVINLSSLVVLSLAQNKLSGNIPDAIGSLTQLNVLSLDGNNLTGNIPASIGNCRQLQKLNLSHNSLVGSIPKELFRISSLSQYLDLSYNHLSGEIPAESGSLINLGVLSISNNRLSGNIPSTLGQCVLLESLKMQSNLLQGSIPHSFANLAGMEQMDLSENNLSGNIPGFLSSLSSLRVLNLSFNNFDGAVPVGGVFSNAGIGFLQGNDRLCANVPESGLPLCPVEVDLKGKHKSLVLKIVIPVVAFAIITLACLVLILRRKRLQSMPHCDQANKHLITFEDIVKATNQFSSANLIGAGSFGTVYKGCLELEDDVVAIKIFDLDIFGANKGFLAECGTLKNIRHRNLVRVITLCSSLDLAGAEFKALVFKYMPNGNLETWLHPRVHEQGQKETLNLRQRINIALDVAFALDYLHNQCANPIIHCDLKPSNVLLDLDMTACIGDFGLAKFLSTTSNVQHSSSASLARLKGSIGYIAPEYGTSVEVSTKGDVYSFGILLLEMITGSRATDEKFSDGISTTMHDFVYRAFPNKIYNVVDPVLFQQDQTSATDLMQSCIIPLLRVGLSCSMTLPKARPGMGKVSDEILTIKHAFSNIRGTGESIEKRTASL